MKPRIPATLNAVFRGHSAPIPFDQQLENLGLALVTTKPNKDGSG